MLRAIQDGDFDFVDVLIKRKANPNVNVRVPCFFPEQSLDLCVCACVATSLKKKASLLNSHALFRISFRAEMCVVGSPTSSSTTLFKFIRARVIHHARAGDGWGVLFCLSG